MRRTPVLLGCTLLLLLLAVSLPGHAAERLGRRIMNRQAGYSVRILDGFDQIPVPPDADKALDRFLGKQTYFGQAGLRTFRFPKPPEKKEEDKPDPAKERRYGDEEKRKKEEQDRRRRPFRADTFRQALSWMNGREMAEGKKLKVGKVVARYFEFDIRQTSFFGGSIPTEDGGEFALFFWAPKKTYRKDFRGVFRQSLKSFRFEKAEAGIDLADLTPSERKRAEKKSQIKRIPGWYSIDTENYVVLSNSEDRALVKYIAKTIERIRNDVYMDLFPPVEEITALSVVRVCKTRDEYFRYGGPPGSAGYWNSRAEELVFYDRFPNMSKKKSRANSLAVLYHEAFHQYIFYAFGELAPHSWFNEGHGDYFAGADFRGRKVKIQPFSWRVGRVKTAAMQNQLVPLDKFVRFTQKKYYANGGQNYAQGWAFIYFLRTVTKNEEYKQILPKYFNALKEEIEVVDRIEEERRKKAEEERKKKEAEERKGKTTEPPPPKPKPKPEPDPDPDPVPQPPPGDGDDPAGDDPEGKPEPEPDLEKPDPEPSDEDEKDTPDEPLPPDEEEEKAGEVAPPSVRKTRDKKLVEEALKKAVDRAFEGIDMKKLDARFQYFVKRGL